MAGNPINWRDLYDFSNNKEIKAATRDIEKLTKAYEYFSAIVTTGAMDSLSEQYKNLAESVRQLVTESKALNITNRDSQKALVDNAKKMQQLEISMKAVTEAKKAAQKVDFVLATSVDGLTVKLKGQIDAYNAHSQSTDEARAKAALLAQGIIKTRQEIKLLTDATKASVATFKAAKGSYDALNQETKQLEKQLKGMANGMSATNREANKLKEQIRQNTERLKAFDKEMGQNFRNVGNYNSAFGGLVGNLKSYALGLVSISALTSGISAAFTKSLKFDSVKRGIDFVSGSALEAQKNLSFLRKTANDFGLDFAELATGFRNFAAAAKDTNFEGETTRRIFKAVAEASAVLGISTDDTAGVMRALGQIMSKGKVQAEELRGQLGDRLSGAFQLFAKGLGITTAQLDVFLKKGQITSDALVPFAAQLEKTFGPGIQNSVNSLQAATNRLGNTFDALFQSSELSRFFAGLITATDSLIHNLLGLEKQSLKTAIAAQQEATYAQKLVTEYEALDKKVNKTAEDKDRLQQIVALLSAQFGQSVVNINKETGALELNVQATKDLITQKLLLANDRAAEAAQGYVKYLQIQKESTDNLTIAQKRYNAAVKAAGQDYNAILKDPNAKATPGNSFTSLGVPIPTLTKEQEAVVGAYESIQMYGERAADAGEKVKGFTADLEALNFTAKDVDKLLNPEPGKVNVIPNPIIEGDDKGKAERERQRKIKAAQDLIKSIEAMELKNLEFEYALTDKNNENDIKYANEKYGIVSHFIDEQQKLYAKGTDDYNKLEAAKIDATADRVNAVAAAEKREADSGAKNAEQTLKQISDIRVARDAAARAELERADKAKLNALKIKRASIGGAFSNNTNELNAVDDEIYNLSKSQLERDIQQYTDFIDSKTEKDEQYYQKVKELTEARKDLADQEADYLASKAEQAKEARIAAEQAAFDFAQIVVASYTEVLNNGIETNIDSLNAQKDADIELAGENAEAKKAIEREYQKKIADEKRKQSNNEKNAATFSIFINMAIAAARAFADYPFPASAIIAALALAGAGAQLVAVESKSVPQYEIGRTGGPPEIALVNEAGPELIGKDGNYRIANEGKPGLTYLRSGEDVITADNTIDMLTEDYANTRDHNAFIDSLLRGTGVFRQKEQDDINNLASAIANNGIKLGDMTAAFSNAIEDMALQQVMIDERGINTFTKRKNQRTQDLYERNKIGGKG